MTDVSDDTQVMPRVTVDGEPTIGVPEYSRVPAMPGIEAEQRARMAAVQFALKTLTESAFDTDDIADVFRLATWVLYGVDNAETAQQS